MENKDYYDKNSLYSEIGNFIVEFEDLIHTTKESIMNQLQTHENCNKLPIKILLQDSTAAPLTNYFRSICMHYISLNEKTNKVKNDKLKSIVQKCSNQLNKAGELRNDIVHSSWLLSTRYGTTADGQDYNLKANRLKLTSKGIEMKELLLKPNRLDNSIKMLSDLSDIINLIGHIISSKTIDALMNEFDQELSRIEEINFEQEKNKLFESDERYYDFEISMSEYFM